MHPDRRLIRVGYDIIGVIPKKMPEVPTLFSLCVQEIAIAVLDGYEYAQDILELPSDLVDCIILNLPPLALQNIYELSVDGCGKGGIASNGINDGRKRGRFHGVMSFIKKTNTVCKKRFTKREDNFRYGDFNTAWKMLFKKRWPEHIKKIQPINCVTTQYASGMCSLVNQSVDWQQLYWEKHLQSCLDDAAEIALLPAFDGYIGELRISDSIVNAIGHTGNIACNCLKLSYHCNKFGHYARCLKLQNVLCVAEICELLRGSKLQALVFRRIISSAQVNGLCMLLNQHWETLLSLEFIYCRLPPNTINQICNSICKEGSRIHGIQHLCVRSSTIFDRKSSSMPPGLLSFISSGRSLVSLHFCETKMQPIFATIIFDTLLQSSSGIVTLEISDNNIAGWLSKVDKKSTDFSSLLGSNLSLKSLSVLSLRGNNLHKEDAEELNRILVHMPNLRSLDLSDNPLTDDGIRNLIPYIIRALEKAHPLSDIKIENCNLSGMGVSELLGNLPTLKEPLKTLSLADNDLGSYVAAPLAKFLGNSGVRVLNIEDIELGPLGFQELEKEMPNKMALFDINISKNRGGIRAAYFVAKVILQAPDLVSINAGGNIMPPESVKVIYDALKQSKGKLERLDFTGNTQLCHSSYISVLLEFHCHGKPIVVIPSLRTTDAPYDDDP
ncbi:uncharacterized protein [Elaeis guineensis]|uniref:Uncharacterized protein LOC105059159 isoform X2 n=1 Tax=Elaeis guineensis var. tenera TaxID=51953 RepID=A0A6I9SC21_ELAGV|nr:uncharacterized protein LOC105059159 isoform X2 [Elaeis guineensis]